MSALLEGLEFTFVRLGLGDPSKALSSARVSLTKRMLCLDSAASRTSGVTTRVFAIITLSLKPALHDLTLASTYSSTGNHRFSYSGGEETEHRLSKHCSLKENRIAKSHTDHDGDSSRCSGRGYAVRSCG
jgi:hypothetical protein